MKITARNEWILIGVTILYLAFVPSPPMMRELMKNPVVKALALAGVVYTWKFWSPILAILFLIAYVRSGLIETNVWEMFSGAEATCTCNGTGFKYDPVTKKCKNGGGAEGTVAACSCASGYAWDVSKKECVPNTDNQPPVPPVSPTIAASMSAPAESTEPVTSTAPITTPGAAMDMATAGTGPQASSTTGVQPTPTGSTSSTPGNV